MYLLLFVLFLTNIIPVTIGCKWHRIHNDAACWIFKSYGQDYTKEGCLDRCSREQVTYCSFAEGFNYALLAGCGTTPDCCIGSDHCKDTISGINADTYECIPTQEPTSQPTNASPEPTASPSNPPTLLTSSPTISPSRIPSKHPILHPSESPTYAPTKAPTNHPTEYPTVNPTNNPTSYPTRMPSFEPTFGTSSIVGSTHHPIKHLTELGIFFIIFGCMFVCGLLFCGVHKLSRISKPRIQQTNEEQHVQLLPLKDSASKPRIQITNSLCDKNDDIRQQHDKLLQSIHEYYETIQKINNAHIHLDIDFIQNLLDIHHDILNNEHYESFMFGSNHSGICNNENCVSFKDVFEAIKQIISGFECDNELLARCEIVDKIHFSHRKALKMSNTRSRRYSQLFRAQNTQQFDLGRKFIYHEDNDQKQCILVSPKAKFDDLKYELINNDIVKLTIKQYQIQLHKAACYLTSNLMKKLCNHKKTHIPKECVLVLMIYCNFDKFQREFSKTYREQWEKHDNFFYFGKTLKEAVLDFGRKVQEGRVKKFYHGVAEVLVPSEIIGDLCEGISIYGPLSSSSSLSIANRFAGEASAEGIIMTLGGNHSDAKYFAVYALSDYPHEHEHLFLQNDAKIELLNIHLVSSGDEFHSIIEELKTFDAIMYQSTYHKTVDFDLMRSYINTYIRYKLEGKQLESKTNEYSSYTHQLIGVYFLKKRKLIVDYSVLQKMCKDVFHLFCEESWIRVKCLMIVFPNIEEITIKGICLSESIMKDIYETHRAIFDPHTNDLCIWKLKRMTLYVNTEKSSLKATDAVLKYNGKIAPKNTVQLNIYQQQNRGDIKHHIVIIERNVEPQDD